MSVETTAKVIARKREKIEEAKALIGRYSFMIRCTRWAIATLEQQIRDLEADRTPRRDTPELSAAWKDIMQP